MGQVLSVYFGTRNRTIASLLASALTYYFKRKYGNAASFVTFVLYLSGMLQYRNYLINGGIVRKKTIGPLKDIVVLDLSNGISGPGCGTILSDLGAQTINVESLDLPDHARFLGSAVSTGMAGLFAHTGRGKQSIVLDLMNEKGQGILKKLIEKSDVVLISNLSTKLIKKFHISYQEASLINENIIYFENIFTSGSNNIKAYEPVMQAASGLASMMNNRLVPEAFCCKIGSITGAQAICSALTARNNGVGGQYIRMDPLKCTLQYIWCDGFQSETFKQDIAKKKKPADWKKLYPNKKKQVTTFNTLDAARKEKTFKRSVGKGNHFIFGEFRHARFPAKYENTQVVSQKKDKTDNDGINPTREAPPMIGEHTVKLLKELQYDDGDVEVLCNNKIAISTTNFLKEKLPGKSNASNRFKWVEYLQEGNTFGDTTKTIPKKNASSIDKFNDGPLTGVKVVEICTRISGPLATQILADQGATVIKLELDKDLDPARKLGPMGNKKLGAIFANCNRNKYGMTIKCSGKMKRKGVLKYIIGKKENEQLNQYFKWADVVIIDQEKEHAMSLTHERVKSINRNVIYVPILEEKTEMVTQGLIGQCYQSVVATINKKLAAAQAKAAAAASSSSGGGGPDEENPVEVDTSDHADAYVNMPINAKYVAGFVATCVTAALVARTSPNTNENEAINTRIGQKVDISSLQVAYYMTVFDKHYNYTWLKNPFLPNFPEMYELSDIFTCKGGEKVAMYIPITERDWENASKNIINVVMGSKKDKNAGNAASAMGLLWHENKDKWNEAPFARISCTSDIAAVMHYCVSTMTFQEFEKTCLENNISFALVKNIKDVVSSDSSYVQTISHKKLGEYTTPIFGVEFTRTPCTLRKAAPLKDEDKKVVLELVGKAKVKEEES